MAQKLSEHRHHKNFPRVDGSATPPDFHAAVQHLQSICQAQPCSSALKDRLSIYEQQTQVFEGEQSVIDSTEKKAKIAAVRRYRESIFGPTKLAQSILSVQVNLGKAHTSTHDQRVAAAGNLTYTCGQAFNLLELTGERVVDEADHRRDKRNNVLPEQRIEDLQQRLGTMKAQLQ